MGFYGCLLLSLDFIFLGNSGILRIGPQKVRKVNVLQRGQPQPRALKHIAIAVSTDSICELPNKPSCSVPGRPAFDLHEVVLVSGNKPRELTGNWFSLRVRLGQGPGSSLRPSQAAKIKHMLWAVHFLSRRRLNSPPEKDISSLKAQTPSCHCASFNLRPAQTTPWTLNACAQARSGSVGGMNSQSLERAVSRAPRGAKNHKLFVCTRFLHISKGLKY